MMKPKILTKSNSIYSLIIFRNTKRKRSRVDSQTRQLVTERMKMKICRLNSKKLEILCNRLWIQTKTNSEVLWKINTQIELA